MILQGNQMEKAFKSAGVEKNGKQRQHREKQFSCKRCGEPMIHPADTNIMYCSSPKCNNYYVFK